MKEKIEFLDYLEDILGAMSRIGEYTLDMQYDDFTGNNLVQDGVIRQIEIIGEASKRIPDFVKDKNPHIPWRNMAGMRDKMIHGYSGVDLDVVWRIVTENIPEVKPEILKILNKLKR